MKKLFIKILGFIKKSFKKLQDSTKEYIPLAIHVVEAIKKVMDSPVDDIVLTVLTMVIPNIPKEEVNVIKDKIQAALPKILLELNIINSIANIEDTNAILDAIKVSPDDIKAEKYHTLASKLLVILSDGKVT
jgi:division protein CdvB (Snf7/Vps24/ESCRT-III family)